MSLSSQKWRLIKLDLKASQLQRNAVFSREMFFTALGTRVHVQESPKKWLASAPGTCRPMLWSGKDQLAFSVTIATYTLLLQAIAVCFVSEQGRGQVGKAQWDASAVHSPL